MPSTFNDFGVHFLYPDNWSILSCDSDESSDTVTLEMPNGGFFSVTNYSEPQAIDELLSKFAFAMREEYPQAEIEEIVTTPHGNEATLDLSFYYLDLLIVARVTAMTLGEQTVVVQVQAESRDFDAGELVFAAMLKSIRDGVTAR
jgi:hypothetical protein